MSRALWLKKILKGRSKGVSSVIGTVFLVLIVFGVSTNVFLWTISQNAVYNQAVNDTNQKNVDRINENLRATEGNCTTIAPNKVRIEAKLTNEGPIAAQVITLWVHDITKETYGFNNSITSMSGSNMNPGQEWDVAGPSAIKVDVPGALTMDTYAAYFMTARGNKVWIEGPQFTVIREVAEGFGSISMDFASFRYYITPGIELGPAIYSYTIPASQDIVFGLVLTNWDLSEQPIILNRYSCVWLYSPSKRAVADWAITKVVDGKLATFDYVALEYGKPTLVYFGKNKGTALAGSGVAVNIMLCGKIGFSDYGQNIPFVAVVTV